MGMNFAGALLSKKGLSTHDIERCLKVELEEIQATVFEEDPFVLGGEEDDIAILTMGSCTAIWFNYDWVGYSNFDRLTEIVDKACVYFIGETAGAYHVEWFQDGQPDGTDDYEDGEVYHLNGTNRLSLDEGDLYFDGILPLIEEWGGNRISEDYPVKIYRTKAGEFAGAKTDSRVRPEGEYRFSDIDEFEQTLNNSLSEPTANPGGVLLAFQIGLTSMSDAPLPGFYKGVQLVGNGTAAQRRAMFEHLRTLLNEWKSQPITSPEARKETRKILLHFAQNPGSFPGLLMRTQRWDQSEVVEAKRVLMVHLDKLAALNGQELRNQFQLVYDLADTYFVLGGEFPTSADLSGKSIAELKKDIYFPIYALKDNSPSIELIRGRVYPALGELFRRGQDPIDVKLGNFNPDSAENQISGKGSGASIKIGGVIVGILIVIRIIYKLVRAMGN
ncbi:hypothetical protein [Phaeocystidibacter luteus]|uniref:Uncharacterized protein n=1 Tax=Phaeocystidibacter luteus TaxID=911197 RepID=A0A6N6RHS7_9FLAO|nr:hypothetical protein [Phaeocystidibacter luteus]KAB2809822.1 hypothetical protein F8C67_09725 [Phaeocystidibacter luteus]